MIVPLEASVFCTLAFQPFCPNTLTKVSVDPFTIVYSMTFVSPALTPMSSDSEKRIPSSPLALGISKVVPSFSLTVTVSPLSVTLEKNASPSSPVALYSFVQFFPSS